MQKEPDNPKFIAICWVVCCACVLAAGCQRRAYTDLYAESMAGEIRELEDRIYEFDAAYQGIEQELNVLQSENRRLHSELAAMRSQPPRSSSSSRSLSKGAPESTSKPSSNGTIQRRQTPPVEPDAKLQITPSPDPVPDSAPKPSGSATEPSIERLPPPVEAKPVTPEKPKLKVESDELQPPTIELGTPSTSILPPSSGPASESLPSQTPSLSAPNSDSLLPPPIKDALIPPPNTGTQNRSLRTRSGRIASGKPANSEALPAELQPIPTDTTAIRALPAEVDDQAINSSRIDLPISIQPATFQQPASDATKSTPQDKRVIEIAFHPTLCRGQFLNSNDSQDGMYLVLQPRNASGEPVDIPGALTIVVLDPNRPENQDKLGRWALTEEQVDACLEPVGIGHGYHIPLSWQEAKPSGDAVQVYIRYEMADGRRLINERRIQLHVASAGSASWTPRVAK